MTQYRETTACAIDLCLRHEVPFAMFRLPGGGDVAEFYSAVSDVPRTGSCQLPNSSHGRLASCYGTFHINRYNTPGSANLHIDLRHDATTTVEMLSGQGRVAASSTITHVANRFHPTTVSREEYLRGVAKVVADLQAKPSDHKVVIARTITGTNHDLDVVAAARRLWETHPMAFGYLFYHPETGLWLGATPELLLDADVATDTIRTMALAGTMPADRGERGERRERGERGERGEREAKSGWSDKNIREQQIVRQYIEQILLDTGATLLDEKTSTVAYGQIVHLCTDISARYPYKDIASLIDRLSPTPAVCGNPLAYALHAISECEDIDRRCYAGYIALERNGRFTAMVNIRCANIDPASGAYCIYTGSGITSSSVPEDEWDETSRKATTLVTCLSNIVS